MIGSDEWSSLLLVGCGKVGLLIDVYVTVLREKVYILGH